MYFVHTSRLERTRHIRTQKAVQPTQIRLQVATAVQPTYKICYSRLEQIDKKRKKEKKILGVMARGKQVKSARVNLDCTKARKVTESISLEDLMEKELQSSLEDGAIQNLYTL